MPELSPEFLARHDGWLRALIRRLVDDGQTDDVLQEVWGHALRTPPRDRKALPAWLATVARRVASRRRRSAQRRRARELEVARSADPAGVDPAELVARVEQRQHVARAVIELAEPFRTVVLLRYFEDLEPAAIARRLDVPTATVRTRLHRAHDKLRERFERDRGSEWRGQLALLCLPLGQAAPLPTPGPDTLARAPRLAALAALPLLLAIGIWWAFGSAPVDAPAAASPGTTAPAATGLAATPSTGRRLTAPTPTDPLADTPTEARDELQVAGHLRDHAGRPLAHAAVLFESGPNAARSFPLVGATDADGRFDVRLPREDGALMAGDDLATLRGWAVRGSQNAPIDDAVVIGCRRIRVAGRVLDETGAPAADQRVEVAYYDTHGFPEPVAGTQLVQPDLATTTDALGRFELTGVPAFPFGDLRVGMIKATVPIPLVDTDDLDIVLGAGRPIIRRAAQPEPRPPARRNVTITGLVVDAAGAPIAGALVRPFRMYTAPATGADGRFRAEASVAPDAPAVLWVAAEGHAPQRREVWLDPGSDEADVVMTLRAPALAMSGRVVDASGEPVVGIVVALADATPLEFGSLTDTPYVECPARHEFGAHGETAADGSFRIEGMLARPYQLRVFDAAAGFAQTLGPFEPGAPCTLRIPARRQRDALNVRVVDLHRRPVADARVVLSVVKLHVESDTGFGTMTSTSFLGPDRTEATDADGACGFDRAPAGEVRLTITRPGWIPLTLDLGTDASDLVEARLLRQVPFRVATPGLDDRLVRLALFDAADRPLEVLQAWRGDRQSNSHSFGIHRGRSVVAAVAETVLRAELRDMFSDELLREMPVVVHPGQVTALDFPPR